MPPTDAGTAVEQAPADATAPDAAPGTPAGTGTDTQASTGTGIVADAGTDAAADAEDTLDLHLPDDFVARFVEGPGRPPADDLLDGVGDRGPVATPVGVLQLVPVRLERDLPLVARWMNDPAVAEFWQLAGEQRLTEVHLGGQLDGDGRSVPCVGLLDGTPMSYWEIYRADLDPLARHYPARPHDTGVHLLIGSDADRGRGLGSALLRAVADLILDTRPACARVVAEPDLRNASSVTAFLAAGFRYAAEVDLPGKRAALMLRDRSLRHLM
ncbi:GNAT family N-acetyltransferase [Streptomyces sp. SID10815]|uniref:GNAT family N-acetyltransferase n=1 Tax=Streptomyces sp. SID10815 TaxID=2706027 RepID=UPI0013C93ACE|nr:GNAT family N-acetyltransferase [Streptomyces sp. SID10815]NEA49782.1 acetyltransferase [Streptomyces sp. SID10815]